MRSCALLTALLLAGCATPNPIVSASDREVIVNRGDIGIAAAGKLAEEHCARYGKRAVFKARVTDFSNVYDCVP